MRAKRLRNVANGDRIASFEKEWTRKAMVCRVQIIQLRPSERTNHVVDMPLTFKELNRMVDVLATLRDQIQGELHYEALKRRSS